MKKWATKIIAIDPKDGQLKNWCGPDIEAETIEEAKLFCKNYLGYCEVEGELIEEVDANDVIGLFVKGLNLKRLVINGNNVQ